MRLVDFIVAVEEVALAVVWNKLERSEARGGNEGFRVASITRAVALLRRNIWGSPGNLTMRVWGRRVSMLL